MLIMWESCKDCSQSKIYEREPLSMYCHRHAFLTISSAILWLLVGTSSYLWCPEMKLFLILPHYVLSYCAKLWSCFHHIREWHCWNLLLFIVFVFIVFHCFCKHLGYHKMLKPDCSL